MSAGARNSGAEMAQLQRPPLQQHHHQSHMQQQLTPPSADEAEELEEEVEHPQQRKRGFEDNDELPCPGCEHEPVLSRWKGKQKALNASSTSAYQNSSSSTPPSRAEMTVMPFLAHHIPAQYNAPGSAPQAWIPQEDVDTDEEGLHERTSTRYCYRHQPDMKCRRQANEPSMKELQNELASLSYSDQQAISHVWSLFSAAPSKHRDLMLQGILSQCCFPQLSSISSSLRSLLKIDFLSALPTELGFRVLCFLDTTSLCKAAQVSRRWREMADDDVVWHRMCEQHIDRKCTKCGWGLPLLERKRLIIEKQTIERRAKGRGEGIERSSRRIAEIDSPEIDRRNASTPTGQKRRLDHENEEPSTASKRQCLPPSSSAVEGEAVSTPQPEEHPQPFVAPPQKRPWKDVYKARFKVGTNWKHGRFRTRVFRGHTNGVMCLQFDDNVLITGSYDSTAKVWDVKTGEVIRTLTGHNSGIRCLQFDESKLMTGSLDGTLRLWDWRKGECLRVFRAHTQGIIALHFAGPWVASGSMDQTIRVWNSERGQTFLLRGHTDWINSVRIDEASRTLFSASDDLTVRLWDLDSRECIRVFEGHVGQVQQVVPLPAEFELDERRPTITNAAEKDDDASSVASGSASGPHGFQDPLKRDTPDPTDEEEIKPFWDKDPERPSPPRYMLTGALDATIRLWDVHFNAASQLPGNAPTPPGPGHDEDDVPAPDPANPPNAPAARGNIPFRMLPTDPLTNSHTPRAQACVRTFFGHVEGIWALAADHLRLISGSEDRMMKVWDPRTGKCERTFTGHQGPVTCCWLSDWGVASGSEDCDVRMLVFGEM